MGQERESAICAGGLGVNERHCASEGPGIISFAASLWTHISLLLASIRVLQHERSEVVVIHGKYLALARDHVVKVFTDGAA